MSEPSKSPLSTPDNTNWLVGLAGGLGLGLVLVLMLGAGNTPIGPLAGIMAGLLLSGAAAMVGGFLGFLFGIPRAKQVTGGGGEEGGAREYLENTNLEQISDWLTKIIVGLTLVEFGPIKAMVIDAGSAFGPSLIQAEPGMQTALGVGVILYFLILGFLFSYLWTRVYMEYVLRRQDAESSRDIDAILDLRQKKESDADAKAMELVSAYLDPDTKPDAPQFADLENVVAKSSTIARTLIFEKARETRQKSWRFPEMRHMVDRTIPVFRGLIAADPGRYHRNYGQLGYALNKATMPDWAGAAEALRKAIELRGDRPDSGMGYYEFNLALALVNLDPGFVAGKASGADARAEIARLLDISSEVLDLKEEPDLARWAKLNDYP